MNRIDTVYLCFQRTGIDEATSIFHGHADDFSNVQDVGRNSGHARSLGNCYERFSTAVFFWNHYHMLADIICGWSYASLWSTNGRISHFH